MPPGLFLDLPSCRILHYGKVNIASGGKIDSFGAKGDILDLTDSAAFQKWREAPWPVRYGDLWYPNFFFAVFFAALNRQYFISVSII